MADSSRVCPWWLAPTLDNPIRRLIHNPENILSGYIERGQKVLDLDAVQVLLQLPLLRWLVRLEKS